jgi:hypothetical protein
MLAAIADKMNHISIDFSEQIAAKMPEGLYHILKDFNLKVEISSTLRDKNMKKRQPSKKVPHWLEVFFSDRAESDDSEISENAENDYSDNDDDDEDEEEEDEGDFNEECIDQDYENED